MAKDLKVDIKELIQNKELKKSIDLQKYITPTVGLPTLNDILQELEKPGRDPRSGIKVFEFDANVKTISDLRTGMELPGIVTNITNLGLLSILALKKTAWCMFPIWLTGL